MLGEPQLVLTDVTTHPEMLAIARLLISSQRTPGIQPQDIAARLGFPYPGSPHPLDPLQSRPSRLPRANGGAMAINIPARLRAAGKLLARKRPHLLPVYDSRVKKVLNRPRTDSRWWHDLRDQLISDQNLIRELESARDRAGAGHMSLLRVFDAMCWMFSWEGAHGPCGQEMPD